MIRVVEKRDHNERVGKLQNSILRSWRLFVSWLTESIDTYRLQGVLRIMQSLFVKGFWISHLNWSMLHSFRPLQEKYVYHFRHVRRHKNSLVKYPRAHHFLSRIFLFIFLNVSLYLFDSVTSVKLFGLRKCHSYPICRWFNKP